MHYVHVLSRCGHIYNVLCSDVRDNAHKGPAAVLRIQAQRAISGTAHDCSKLQYIELQPYLQRKRKEDKLEAPKL